tara:strand:- start:1335 stop:2132 length:798 start_codon:yes stop_codon:yes gene_type:complete
MRSPTALLSLLLSFPLVSNANEATVPNLEYSIVNRLSIPGQCVTQGLAIYKASIFISCGGYGKSRLVRLSLHDGSIISQLNLPEHIYAEGVDIISEHAYVLTWRAEQALIVEIDSMSIVNYVNYDGEGWGLTRRDERFLMTNGTSTISEITPTDFTATAQYSVTTNSYIPIRNLNDLTLIGNYVAANILNERKIAIFNHSSPDTLVQAAFIDLQPIHQFYSDKPAGRPLNGITYDEMTNLTWISGKNWGDIYALAIDYSVLKYTQ